MSRRIENFQGLRVLAFGLVFVSHCANLMPFRCEGWGAVGVEIFFVMAGFLSALNDRDAGSPSLRQSVHAVRKKLSKFYLPHILTMLMTAAPVLAGMLANAPDASRVREFLLCVAANVFLVQSYIPLRTYYFSLNAVSWYLSSLMLMVVLLPYLNALIGRLAAEKARLFAVLAAIFALQLLLAAVLQQSDRLHYWVYINPMVRTLDFLLGMLLCALYRKAAPPRRTARSTLFWSALELASVLLLAGTVALFYRVPEAFCYVCLSVPAAAALSYVLAFERGVFSRALRNPVFLFLASISMEMFLLHRVIIIYWEYPQWIFRTFFGGELSGGASFVLILALTITGGWLLQRFDHALTRRIGRKAVCI